MASVRTACVAAALLVSLPSLAGERPLIWAYDTNIVSNGNVELEQWLWATGSGNYSSAAAYWLWWSPVVGLTRHLEVAAPFQVVATGGTTSLASFDADLRWRLFPGDDQGGFQGLVRTAFHQVTSASLADPSRVDFTLSASYGALSDKHFVLELGGQLGLPGLNGLAGASPFTGTWDAGFAYPLKGGEFHWSVETFGKVGIAPSVSVHPFVGGSLAWTSGRFWATLGVLVGVSSEPTFLPRLIWAVSL